MDRSRNRLCIDTLGGLSIEGVDRTLDVDLGSDCVYVSTSPMTADSNGWITLTFADARALAVYLTGITGPGEATSIEGSDQA